MAKFIVLTGVDAIKDHVNIDLIAYFHRLDNETLVAFAAGKTDKFLGLRVIETPDEISELIQARSVAIASREEDCEVIRLNR